MGLRVAAQLEAPRDPARQVHGRQRGELRLADRHAPRLAPVAVGHDQRQRAALRVLRSQRHALFGGEEHERARILLENAEREAARTSQLLANKAISTEEAEARQSRHEQARAALLAAEAARETARLDLDHTEVRAPISGRASAAGSRAADGLGARRPLWCLTAAADGAG